MLHGALPRVFLSGVPAPPAVGPLGYHYVDELRERPFAAYPRLDEAYALRLGEQRLLAWEASLQQQHHQLRRQSETPCPLDLSLKPATTSGDECEAIEVDDEEDRRSREEARSLHLHRRDDDEDSQRSCSSASLGYATSTKLGLCSPGQPLHQSSYEHLLRTPPPSHQPMTPPSTPSPPQCPYKRKDSLSPSKANNDPGSKTPRGKKKHARRLKFDEDTSSPVSGTVILGPDEAIVTGDIDPAFNIVEVTDEARAELAKIENRLGPYQCKLCRQLHDDAFQLAQHRCSRIAHVEYRCPECDKRFSCPANLASHRRWHKPRPAAAGASSSPDFACPRCEARFTKQAALRKHVAIHHADTSEPNNNLHREHEAKVTLDDELA